MCFYHGIVNCGTHSDLFQSAADKSRVDLRAP